ncbi:hypothetical protein A8D71_39065 [Burkholderia cenocepacia]|nr:hypothetical protein A8D71_39065 [Burkholderia cenocepacia]
MDAIRTVIEPYETALRTAMLSNDVEALDALLDDDLVFTAPTGQVISKEDDLTAHRAKLLRLDDLPPANRASRNLVKFVFGEDEHEEALFGRANHWLSEGSRGRYAGQGTVQEARVQ